MAGQGSNILAIVANRQLKESGYDTVLLVITSGIASQFEDLVARYSRTVARYTRNTSQYNEITHKTFATNLVHQRRHAECSFPL